MPRGISDHRGRFRLAEAVSNRDSPSRLHAVDDLRIQRFTRTDQFPERETPAKRREILLDQHAPDGRWRTERRDAATFEHGQHRLRIEARVVVDEDAGPGVPGREEAAPRVLCPPRGRDVEMDVARTKADPVHRREMPYRVALVRVQHELGLGRGPRGEVEEQRIRCARSGVGRERGREAAGFGEVQPAGVGSPTAMRVKSPPRASTFGGICRTGDDVSYGTPRDSIPQIVTREKAGRRDQHHAQLDGREHDLP